MFKYLNIEISREDLSSTAFQRNKYKALEILKSGAGFTFTELMVIIAVITVFTVISFPYYNNVRESLALDRAAIKLAQDFRKAQEMAMSSYEFSGSVPSGGYGIYFNIAEPDHYILFADMDADIRYDAGELVEDIYLESGVQLDNCETLLGMQCEEFAAIYLPPNPEGFFEIKPVGGGWQSANFNTNVEFSINVNSKIINLNKAGLIDID